MRGSCRVEPSYYRQSVDIADAASAAGQVASALLAIPVAFIAYYAHRTAKSSTDATAALTRIEAMRWHAESRPQIRLTGERTRWPAEAQGPEAEMLAIYVELLGPASLHHVDSVSFEVRNYYDERHPDVPLELPDPPEPYTIMDSSVTTNGRWIVGDRRTFLIGARYFGRPGTLPLKFTLELRIDSYEPWVYPLQLCPEEFLVLEGKDANSWTRPHG